MHPSKLIGFKFKHLIKCLINSAYRDRDAEYKKLLKHPGDVIGSTMIMGKRFHFVDARSFHSQWHEIFVTELLKFKCSHSKPFVLDIGAHVGVATAYVLKNYPEAEVWAYEADPKIAEIFAKNIESQGWTNVKIEATAVWDKDGRVAFNQQSSDSGFVVEDVLDGSKSVKAKSLQSIFNQIGDRPVDLLKMDIEGAETQVLSSLRGELNQVRKIFVEYHSRANDVQDLAKLLHILEIAGFRYHIHALLPAARPLHEIDIHAGYDMLLNIYGWRIETSER